MPDLSTSKITDWLRAREPTIAADLASTPPPPEEHEAILPSILRFGSLLGDCLSRSPDQLRDHFQHGRLGTTACAALAQLGLGRRLRLLHWLGETPGLEALSAHLLQYARGDTGTFLRAELLALHRRAVLARIFGHERIAVLLAACNQAANAETL
jgi:hypothetical protein